MPQVRPITILLSLSLLPIVLCGQSVEDPDSSIQVTFSFGGYAKLDWLITRYFDGEPDASNAIRDIYLPGSIPIGGELTGADTEIHARESRVNFEVKSRIFNSPARMFLEMDFLLSKAGDERVSNSYNPRLRHFFFESKYFLFGQTWTTFMTPEALPDGIIFVNGADGIVFIRQAQVRIKYKGWSFGFENPETTLLPYQEQQFATSTGGFPDLIAKYTLSKQWGTIAFAGIYRTLRYANDTGDRYYASGYGLNASGRINVGMRDDFRFMVSTGEGLGRYIAFQFLTGTTLDQNDELHTIGGVNAMGAYSHHWSPKWRSSIMYSFVWAEDQSEFTGGNANQYAWSTSANLLFAPHPQLLAGFQALYGYRRAENDINGSMMRLQLSLRYNFNFSFSTREGD